MGNFDTFIFDFGGTLDTNGVHWSHKFYDAYTSHNLQIPVDQFIQAYIYAERNVSDLINRKDSFFKTLSAKISLQIDYINSHHIFEGLIKCDIKEITVYCYNDVLKTMQISQKLLSDLGGRFKLGIASNFYGNLETVLEEFSIKHHFLYVFDSAVEGIRKPSPEVFALTVSKLGSSNENTIVVGDSYNKDIEPAKKIGCNTVWILNKPYKKPAPDETAGYIISSSEEIYQLDIFS